MTEVTEPAEPCRETFIELTICLDQNPIGTVKHQASISVKTKFHLSKLILED